VVWLFYESDAFPVAKPMASKHVMKLKSIISNQEKSCSGLVFSSTITRLQMEAATLPQCRLTNVRTLWKPWAFRGHLSKHVL